MRSTKLLELLQIDAPIIQAPMAGVSTPEMAAAVSNAGALGSVGVGATNADLRAHNPSVLLRRQSVALHRRAVRFYVSAGGDHGHIRQSWTVAFAHELRDLRLPHKLWLLPFSESKHFWRATLPSALAYAAAGFRGPVVS